MLTIKNWSANVGGTSTAFVILLGKLCKCGRIFHRLPPLNINFLRKSYFRYACMGTLGQRNAIKDLENYITYTVVHTYLMNNWIITSFTYNGFVVW